MLGYLRRNSDSVLTTGIIVVLSLVFIFFFGSGALNSPRTEVVAEVDGAVIRDVELMRETRRALRLQQRFNPNMTDEDRARVQQQVLDSMIDTELVLQAARDEGLVIPPKELRRRVMEIPTFQDDQGKFDLELYKQFVGEDGRGARSLQDDLREDLLSEKMQDFVRRSVQVSDAEVRRAFEEDSASRNVEFLRVSSALFKGELDLGDAEVIAWADEHAAEVRERYDRDFERLYNEAEQVSARHILVKFEESDADELRAELRRVMEGVLTEARAPGADFAALARKWSEDSSAPRGGDLGFFDRKRMVKPFSDAAFELEVGGISEIVETQYGLHIIKVEEKKEAKVTSFDEARADVARSLLEEERAPELAREFAVKLVHVLDGTLDETAASELLASRNLTVEESGSFTRRERRVPKVGSSPEAVAAAFALQKVGDTTPEPIELPSGYVVMRLKEFSEADAGEFDEKRDQIRDRLLRNKQAAALNAWKNDLKAAARIRIRQGV